MLSGAEFRHAGVAQPAEQLGFADSGPACVTNSFPNPGNVTNWELHELFNNHLSKTGFYAPSGSSVGWVESSKPGNCVPLPR